MSYRASHQDFVGFDPQGRPAFHPRGQMWIAGRGPSVVIAGNPFDLLHRQIVYGLRRDGCTVYEVRVEDLAGWLSERFSTRRLVDVVVLDTTVSSFNLEPLEEARCVHFALPIIALVDPGDLEVVSEAHRLGASAIFEKPFELDDLRTALVNLIA